MTDRLDKGLVSIITPARNAAAHIGETIASVRAQTHAHWEMIVADDNSADATVPIVEAEASRDPRIRLVRCAKEPGLPARVRNAAMAEARGEFIAFLDADDLWAPDKLERQVGYLREHPKADGVCCWAEAFGDRERVRRERCRMRTAPICGISEVINGMPFFTPTLLIRSTCAEGLGGMDEDPRLRSTEDADYFARLVAGYRIHRMRSVLAHYRLAPLAAPSHSLSMLTKNNEQSWNLTRVLEEKGLLTKADLRRRHAHLYYEQARNNLHILRKPFRGALVRCMLTGRPSWQAMLTFSLSFLPAVVLSPLLMGMQSCLNRVKRMVFDRERACATNEE